MHFMEQSDTSEPGEHSDLESTDLVAPFPKMLQIRTRLQRNPGSDDKVVRRFIRPLK